MGRRLDGAGGSARWLIRAAKLDTITRNGLALAKSNQGLPRPNKLSYSAAPAC